MINFETVWFMNLTKELTERMQNGVVDFKDCTPENKDDYVIFYDTNTSADYNEYYEDTLAYRIVLDKVVDELHHDAVDYYDSPLTYGEGYEIRLCKGILENTDNFFISILPTNEDWIMQIYADGSWDVCELMD